jgi:hypothetical protein
VAHFSEKIILKNKIYLKTKIERTAIFIMIISHILKTPPLFEITNSKIERKTPNGL